MLGVALGIFSLIVVLSIMRGFERDFETKILGFQAPVVLETSAAEAASLPPADELKNRYGNIDHAEYRIEGELVIESKFGTASGARVRGIDRSVDEIKGLGHVYFRDQQSHDLSEEAHLPGIVLGAELAATLQVHPDFKDEVRLIFPFGDLAPSGEMMPRVRRFLVVGIFDSGFYEYDSRFALITGQRAQRLFGEFGRSSTALYLHNNKRSETLAKQIRADYPQRSWQVATWRERNQRLFQALFLERLGMILLLSMIIIIACFNIFALLSMIVMEKIKDMAVLRTMGFRKSQLRQVFLWQVGRIGIRGTIMGGVFAIGTCLWLYFFPYELPSTYYIPYLPISLEPLGILLILLLGPLMSMVAGLYPASQASKPIIAEVLRYE